MTAMMREHGWAIDTVAALAALPPVQARALRLCYFDGVRLPEAAERIGVSLASFSRILADALRELGQALNRSAGPDDRPVPTPS